MTEPPAADARTGRVIVVGSLNVDLVGTVERLPSPGETVTGASFARHHGGKGGNQATAAARLGGDVAFIGAVGDDDLGADARESLRSEGIDISEVATIPGPTGVALILVDARGENAIAVASGANGGVEAAAVRGAMGRLGIRPGDVVLVSNEIPLPAVLAAVRIGRAGGATTILNPAPATGLDAEALESVDIVVPNLGELATLASAVARDSAVSPDVDGDTPNAGVAAPAGYLLAAMDRSQGSPAVIVTLGSRGAILITHDREAVAVPAVDVEVVDTVGAGDAFVGSLAVDLAGRQGLEAATRRAVAAAGLSTTRAGAREGMPTRAELEAFSGTPD